MTIKTSISLPDAQAEYARELVERGAFPSLSALVQHSLDLMRLREEDERVDKTALKILLENRAKGPFLAVDTFRKRTDDTLREAARAYALDD